MSVCWLVLLSNISSNEIGASNYNVYEEDC